MKTKLILLALTLGASTSLLTAQDGNSRPGRERGLGGRGGPGGMRMPNPIIEALDLNKDGVIDTDEIAKASASLKTLDKDGDGKLTTHEIHPQRPGGLGGPRGQGGRERNRRQRPQAEE